MINGSGEIEDKGMEKNNNVKKKVEDKKSHKKEKNDELDKKIDTKDSTCQEIIINGKKIYGKIKDIIYTDLSKKEKLFYLLGEIKPELIMMADDFDCSLNDKEKNQNIKNEVYVLNGKKFEKKIEELDYNNLSKKEKLFYLLGQIDESLISMVDEFDISSDDKKSTNEEITVSSSKEEVKKDDKEDKKVIYLKQDKKEDKKQDENNLEEECDTDEDSDIVDYNEYVLKRKKWIKRLAKGTTIIAACLALAFGLKFALSIKPKDDIKNDISNEEDNKVDDEKKYNTLSGDIDEKNDDNGDEDNKDDNKEDGDEVIQNTPIQVEKGVMKELLSIDKRTAEIDINGDGTVEKIEYKILNENEFIVIIDGKESEKKFFMEDSAEKTKIYTYSFDGKNLYIVYNVCEANIGFVYHFLKYQNGEIIECGNIAKEEMKCRKDGIIEGWHCIDYFISMQTNEIKVLYDVDSEGKLKISSTNKKKYKYGVYDFLVFGSEDLNYITLQKEIKLAQTPGGKEDIIMHPGKFKQTKVTSTEYEIADIYNDYSYGKEDSYKDKDSIWVYLESEDNTKGWFHLTNEVHESIDDWKNTNDEDRIVDYETLKFYG